MKAIPLSFTNLNFKHLLLPLTLLTPISAYADALSFTVGGGVWNETPEGNYQKTSDNIDVSVTENLFWEEEYQGYVFAALEHFVPILPNIKIMHTTIDQDGTGSVSTPFIFNGQTINVDVIDDASLESLDLYAYYEILDNVVSFDLGLNIRSVDIDYNIDSSALSQPITDSFSATLPLLYGMIGATPWPDLTVSGELSYIAYDGSSISDLTAKISYTTEFFLGLEFGYRKQSYEFDDIDNNDVDLSFDGVFAGANLKF